jgi:hypothetical protein
VLRHPDDREAEPLDLDDGLDQVVGAGKTRVGKDAETEGNWFHGVQL